MKAGVLILFAADDFRQLIGGDLTNFDKGEVRFLANSHIGMTEKLDEIGERTIGDAGGKNFARIFHERISGRSRFVNAIDAAFAGFLPTLNPIENVEAAARTELDVHWIYFPKEIVDISGFKGGPARLEREGADAAGKIGHEKMIEITRW